jgi:Zn-dependent oligopeptidase
MGYASFAHMAMVGKMAHTPEAARQLLEVLSLLALLVKKKSTNTDT